MSDWWMHENAERLPSRDGIPARSQRGEIGETWWSRRFIAALREVTDPSRLTRGRSYARSGQVMDLRVAPGLVTAGVQGSRPVPYQVRIALPPFTDEEWERAERALAGQALFLAALLAGEMPRDVEEAFRAADLSLFPTRPDELSGSCTCPDPMNPCKHIAATLYILAEAFDEDPFLVLAWRGRPRELLLERLRALRGAAPAGDAAADAPAVEPEPRRTGGFWHAGPELEALHFAPRAAEVPDAVLRQLGPLPRAAGAERIADALAEAYRVFTAAAERRAFGDSAPAPGGGPSS